MKVRSQADYNGGQKHRSKPTVTHSTTVQNMAQFSNGSSAITNFYGDIYSQWIVPSNSYLLSKNKCHLNVQTACCIKSVKYIYSTFFNFFFKYLQDSNHTNLTYPLAEYI